MQNLISFLTIFLPTLAEDFLEEFFAIAFDASLTDF